MYKIILQTRNGTAHNLSTIVYENKISVPIFVFFLENWCDEYDADEVFEKLKDLYAEGKLLCEPTKYYKNDYRSIFVFRDSIHNDYYLNIIYDEQEVL